MILKKNYFSGDHFIKRISVLLLLFPAVVLLIWGFLIPPQFQKTYLGELKQKEERLADTEGKRIVIIGGSAVAFGIDTGLLQEELTDYTTVNFGLYAALGTRVMMDLAEKDLREGDLVILMPEQQEQTLSLYFNGNYVWQACDGNFAALTRIKSDNIGAMIGTFPKFAADKFRYYVSGQMPEGSGVYRQSSFDENGDMDPALVTENVMAEEYDPTMPADFSEGLPDADMIAYINDFTERMEAKGVRVLYHLCPVNEKGVEAGTDISAYYEWLRGELDCTLLGNPADSILQAELFYDTNFHLNGSGKVSFTRQLAKDLKAELGITGQTASAEFYLEKQKEESAAKDGNETIPEDSQTGHEEMNGSEESAAETENAGKADSGDSDTGDDDTGDDDTGNDDTGNDGNYIYEENSYGCVITGLTEEGKNRTELYVPGTLNGKPVVRIAENAFSENTCLERAVIAEETAVIEDGAFRGCSSLKKVILLSEKPENCQVGQNLLDGCDAVICVPEGCLSAYKRSYWWSAYADRMEEGS